MPWARKEIENSLKEGDKTAAAAESAANTLAASDKESQPDASASNDKTESNNAINTKVIEQNILKKTYIIIISLFFILKVISNLLGLLLPKESIFEFIDNKL